MPSRRTLLKMGLSGLTMPFILRGNASGQQSRTRKNASAMASDDQFFSDYKEAVAAMHAGELDDDMRGWRSQAHIHLEHCPHSRAEFLVWHRIYLAKFEEICGDLIGKQDFALAYWDWTENEGRLPSPFFDEANLNVEHWNDDGSQVGTVAKRALDRDTGLRSHARLGGAFTRRNIDSILRRTDFGLFWRFLEGSPHNNGHVIVGGNIGGHMGNFLSPLDPIFWLHHCNVDRLWAEWQAAGNTMPELNVVFDQQFADISGTRRDYAAQAFTSLSDLRYTYDTLLESDPLSPFILSSKEFEELAVAAGVRKDRAIGSATNNIESFADLETRVNVPTDGLLREIFSSRVFRPVTALDKPRAAVEPRRILARLQDIKRGPEAEKLIGNVFVNCPYLSPEIGVEDEHFAGAFSFFGPGGHHSGNQEFIIDITAPLRRQAEDGRINENSIDIQIMPASVASESGASSFTIGAIEILST